MSVLHTWGPEFDTRIYMKSWAWRDASSRWWCGNGQMARVHYLLSASPVGDTILKKENKGWHLRRNDFQSVLWPPHVLLPHTWSYKHKHIHTWTHTYFFTHKKNCSRHDYIEKMTFYIYISDTKRQKIMFYKKK